MYSVLIVDDDRTCLTVLKGCLRKWNYKVTAVSHAFEALCILRVKSYDLVVADVHMPDMDGFELQEHINHSFSLPVILVSANDSPEVVCKGLKNGAQRFLVKPVSPNDVENLWQYSEWWKKNKKDSTAPVSGIKRSYESYATAVDHDAVDHDVVNSKRTCAANGASAIVTKSISAANVASTIVATRTAEIKPEGAEIEPEKRSNKLIWSRKLHARFVEAMLVIGYERAVPTNILDVMNVPGLTRDQVGSHLQKYQNFLKRVLAGKTSLDCSHWVDVNYYSPIVSGNPDKLLVTKLCDEKRRGVCVRPRKVPAAQSDLSSCRQIRLPLFKLAEGSSMSKTNSISLMKNMHAPSSLDVAAGGLVSATNFQDAYNKNMGNVVGSITTSNPVQNLTYKRNQMGSYNQKNMAPYLNYSGNGGLTGGQNNTMFPSANHIAPSSPVSFGNDFYFQPSHNVGEQGNDIFFDENNFDGDQKLGDDPQITDEMLESLLNFDQNLNQVLDDINWIEIDNFIQMEN